MQASTSVKPLKVLFFMRAINMDRAFENFLREMLERGHSVFVALELEKARLRDDATQLFDSFADRYRFVYEQLPRRTDAWLTPGTALRSSIDYLRYLEPAFADAHMLRQRARVRAPRLLRVLLVLPPFRFAFGRRFVAWVLGRVEAAIPVPRSITSYIKARSPDVVLVSPLVELGSAQGEFLRAAHRARVPTVHVVASWDNLTNKGLIRDVATRTVLWNAAQVEEAVDLHGLPRERVVAVGAHTFDHWFGWQPATSREDYATKVGIDAHRPLVLYVGSSNFIAANETDFITQWLAGLRDHPHLRDVGVVLRPHPQNYVSWAEVSFDDPGRTVVWPRTGAHPTAVQNKHDYFESLHHASAVVGINTSALIEAAIVNRPVLTLVTDYSGTQEGTLHFAHLAGEQDRPGILIVGRSWEEHFDQLADAVASPEGHQERCQAFLSHFVRPHGLDVAAAPLAAAVVEEAAAAQAEPSTKGRLLRPVLWMLTPLVPVVLALLHPIRTMRSIRRALRTAVKFLRRRWIVIKRNLARKQRDRRRAKEREQSRAAGRATNVQVQPTTSKSSDPAGPQREQDPAAQRRALAKAERIRARADRRAQARPEARKSVTPERPPLPDSGADADPRSPRDPRAEQADDTGVPARAKRRWTRMK